MKCELVAQWTCTCCWRLEMVAKEMEEGNARQVHMFNTDIVHTPCSSMWGIIHCTCTCM